ncbi:helix-turn-helix domain-containing protein [Streptomyces sp. NPDC005930]|uniref:nSTAND1 domain-containing NTPase n=1 Tax=Streptomyces sp. NPDC005930 TaxID=3364736 RepID=UPI00369CA639
MPRKESPLPLDDGPVVQFAAELRELRRAAGGPSYRDLAARAHYSVATLSSAAAGRRLPSLEVTRGYVGACGGDVERWEALWHTTAAAVALAGDPADDAAPPPDQDDSPYPGLASFGSRHSRFFFGRERVVEQLRRRLTDQRFIALFGASGAGKSSVLDAGLSPYLRARGQAVVTLTPGVRPLEELAVRLAGHGANTPGRLLEELQADPGNLHLLLRQIVAEDPGRDEVILIVDQFEELFTLCSRREDRDHFINALLLAARAESSVCRIVLGVRADFYASCIAHVVLARALDAAMVTLGPMDSEELHRAICRPAETVGCRVEGRLLAYLIAQAKGNAGMLPLLSHALRETWGHRRGTLLTMEACRSAGFIEHALTRTAERFYEALSLPQKEAARHLFLRLVALGEGIEYSKRRMARFELPPDPDTVTVVERAAAERLITVDGQHVDLTHEALIRWWPRLGEWLTEDRELLHTRRQLTEAAATWAHLEQDPGALLRGTRLEAVRPLAQAEDAGLTPREREFLEASLAAERADRTAATRRKRLRRLLIAASAVLLAISLATSVLAIHAGRKVTAQRDEAVAHNASTAATALTRRSPGLAIQIALAAHRLQPDRHSRDALLSTLMFPWTAHRAEMYAMDVSPDGGILATAGRDRVVRLWDVHSARRARGTAVLTGHRDAVYAVAMHPHRPVLASAGADGSLILWDIRDPQRPHRIATLRTHMKTVRALAFSPSGQTLVSAGSDGNVVLWNTRSVSKPVRGVSLRGHRDEVRSVAFSADGRLLASAGGGDERVILWDTTSPDHPVERADWQAHSTTALSVAFNPRTGVLATSGGGDRPVKLWRVAGRRQPVLLAALDGPTDVVGSVGFSPDGRLLTAGSDDRTARIWRVPGHGRPRREAVLTGFTTAVLGVRFTPDGKQVVTGVFDGTTHTLSADFGRAIAHACSYAGRPLTHEQWRRYLSNVPYRRPC